MKLENHYSTLYTLWGRENTNDVFISDIARELCCSDRHAKSVLKQMINKNWINWEPSVGRGKPSKLTCLVKPTEIEEQKVQKWIQDGDINRAIRWMESQTGLETSFINWLEGELQWTPSYRNQGGMDVLSYPYYRPIRSLVPSQITTRHEGHLAEHIYNRLIYFDNHHYTFHAELAHHWEPLENGRVWRFYLRKNIFFHDGSPLTSNTIVENILLWKTEDIPDWKRRMIEEIVDMETPTSTIITLFLNKPNMLFPHIFTDSKSMIIPVNRYKKDKKTFRTHPIGSGPYQITIHEKGHLVLESFSQYFGYRPALDKVVLYTIPKPYTASRRQVHFRIVDKQSTKVNKLDWFRPEMGGVYLVINHNKEGIHTHPEFSKMLSLAINRIDLFQEHPHHQVWFPDSFFDKDLGPLRQIPDIEKAKEWFRRNGYNGATITLSSTCLEHEAYFGYELEALRTYFKEFGIRLKTKVIDIHDLKKDEHLKNTDLIITGVALGENPLVSMLNTLTSKKSFISNTLPTYAKVQLDALISTVEQSPNINSTYENLRNIECFLLDNYYVILLYQRKVHINVEADEKLQGIEINQYNRLNYKKLWFKS
ncbi:ABC transporter substrate-binding protein (plasmid) [Alkalihalophilus pseudofirmus]|uniref:ABC transporter substrate-binding protein n=1 Tax=Alkalihalophilus pseudofirmus TaxID=79885 RepID=UPI00259B0686|nr:ABC transporter substrate-binding protein [Alkalihalophilus pseudofirmus]WEG19256.1 ABC transporter substrate-binding protein [Alkalihalophilus pseudofirmus]